MTTNTVDEILDDFRQGKMVLMMDDEDRENEGDLIIAADIVTPEHITFFARHACGLICLTLTEERAQQLNLPKMVENNNAPHETNFTVSIEAADGITTGISAADRARTVRMAVAKNAKPDDLVRPGHIFPVVARQGGVLTRAGHTEAGCDLARLAGYEPASVLVEVMNEDGTMAQRPQLERFAQQHGICLGTIADLIHYRHLHDATIKRIDCRSVGTSFGAFQLHTYKDSVSNLIHYALTMGKIRENEPCLVRVQALNTLRDLFQTQREGFSTSWSLQDSLARIGQEGLGALVLVGQEFHQQDEINHILHFPEVPPVQRHNSEAGVHRMIGTGSQILRDVGVGKMRLLSSPMQYNAISGFDLEVVEFVEKK